MKLGRSKPPSDDADDGPGYAMPDLPQSLTDDNRSWWMRSPITLWAAVLVVILAVIGAIVVASVGHDDAERAAPEPSTSAPPPISGAPTQPGTGDGDGFTTPTIDYNNRRVDVSRNPYGQPLAQTDSPATSAANADPAVVPAPQGVKWENFFGLALPYSTSAGPTTLRGPIVSGFTHTPQGAALAGYQILGRQLQGSYDARRAVGQQQTIAADDAAHTRYLDSAITPDAPALKPRLLLRPDAFRVISYAPDYTVIQYAIPTAFGGQDAVTTWGVVQQQLLWSDGQWKLKVGDPDPELPQASSLLGWTTW